MDARPYGVLSHSVPAADRRIEPVVSRLAVRPHELRIAHRLLQPRHRLLPCRLDRNGGLSRPLSGILSGNGNLHDCAALSCLPVLSHVLGGKLVALFHQGDLLVYAARLSLLRIQPGGQFFHLTFQFFLFLVHLRRFVERTELSVDVPVGNRRRVHALSP